MAQGYLTDTIVFQSPDVDSKVWDRKDALFLATRNPYLTDLGYVTKNKKERFYLWNGTTSDVAISSVDVNDISQVVGINYSVVTNTVLTKNRSTVLDFSISAFGPTIFDATFTFNSSLPLIPIIGFKGTRAPAISGDIGHIFLEHNWANGLEEKLDWKTDVLISTNRNEQRMSLRPIPRRNWSLRLISTGTYRNKLESWLSLRKTRFLYAPIWRDVYNLSSPISEGDVTVQIQHPSDNFVVGTEISVWKDEELYEIKKISYVGQNYIGVETPFNMNWGEGISLFGPCRTFSGTGQRSVSRATENAGSFSIELMVVDDKWQPPEYQKLIYREVEVCPETPSFESPDNKWDNKWVVLDNDTGVISYDIQSIEPAISRTMKFVLLERNDSIRFIQFLNNRSGRLVPFWLPSDDKAFKIVSVSPVGSNYIVIDQIGYNFQFSDASCRRDIEICVGNSVIHARITGVETLPTGDEKLNLDVTFDIEVTPSNVLCCSWLELVRFDTDSITLHWETTSSFTTSIPVVTLP